MEDEIFFITCGSLSNNKSFNRMIECFAISSVNFNISRRPVAILAHELVNAEIGTYKLRKPVFDCLSILNQKWVLKQRMTNYLNIIIQHVGETPADLIRR